MADVMVVVDQINWRKKMRERGADANPGDVLDWSRYVTRNRFVSRYLEPGDRLFLVTARGERLWLVAVYNDVLLEDGRDGEFSFEARRPNTTPIVDITQLRSKFRFHTGNRITSKRGMLGNALQTPRMLTDYDLRLLTDALKRRGVRLARARRSSLDIEVQEGAEVLQEMTIYVRNPILALECIKRDNYACRCCGFTVDAKRFPRIADRMRMRIVQAHHIKPVSHGERTSSVFDLLTLCPTCHAVAHALAAAHGVSVVDLKLLKKFYQPWGSARRTAR
jgi:hypothetical protein